MDPGLLFRQERPAVRRAALVLFACRLRAKAPTSIDVLVDDAGAAGKARELIRIEAPSAP